MKINDTIKKSASLGTDKTTTEKTNAVKTESANNKKADKSQVNIKDAGNVTLSPLSAQLKVLEAKVHASKVFDAEKVDAIKSAITNGKFNVDSGKVADGLIATVKDLLTTQ
ncbi:MAG: flagellar biosynthesis anti-sigma factor FlgM [Betaproteobacteria bacterium]